METKKMIVHQLIKQVRVGRGYKIDIDHMLDRAPSVTLEQTL